MAEFASNPKKKLSPRPSSSAPGIMPTEKENTSTRTNTKQTYRPVLHVYLASWPAPWHSPTLRYPCVAGVLFVQVGDMLISISLTTDVQMLYSIKYCVQFGICCNFHNFGALPDLAARRGQLGIARPSDTSTTNSYSCNTTQHIQAGHESNTPTQHDLHLHTRVPGPHALLLGQPQPANARFPATHSR